MSNMSPSFSLVRPIENFNREIFEELEAQFQEDARSIALPVTGVSFNAQPRDFYVLNLVSAFEVASFHRKHNLRFGPDEASALADHLDRELPDSIDDTLGIDTFPLCVYGDYGTGRAMDFRAGAGSMLLEERNLVLTAINNYYDLSGTVDKHWRNQERYTRLSLARIVHKDAEITNKVGDALNAFLTSSPDSLPAEIRLAPLDIRDVTIPQPD